MYGNFDFSLWHRVIPLLSDRLLIFREDNYVHVGKILSRILVNTWSDYVNYKRTDALSLGHQR